MTLDVLVHHQEYSLAHDCEMNYSCIDYEPYKDEKLVVDDLSDDRNFVPDDHILGELVEVVACGHSNMAALNEDRIRPSAVVPSVAVPFDFVELVAAGVVAVVLLASVELVAAVNIVDFVAFVGVEVVEYFAVVEYFVVGDSTNIAGVEIVPSLVALVTFAAVTWAAVTWVVVTFEAVTLGAVTFVVVAFGVAIFGAVTFEGEPYVDIHLGLAQQLIDLNLQLTYLKSCEVDSTLTPSSILDLSEFDLQVSDLPRVV